MSVDYKAALINGWSCNPEDWTCEELEQLEELGWDIIRDNYSDKFLYIGKTISSADMGEEVHINAIQKVYGALSATIPLLDNTPDELFDKFPDREITLYHICYAT